uniref:RING-type domain-containing protein n=1 Tax=Macrostomum lignano TaxID=282301 RepID=A0A1I8GY97_9PLAT
MSCRNDTDLLDQLITGCTDHEAAPERGFILVQVVVGASHPSQLVCNTRLQTSVSPELAKSGLFRKRLSNSTLATSAETTYCCCYCSADSQTGQSVGHSAACLMPVLSASMTAAFSNMRLKRTKTAQLLSSREISQVTGTAWQFGCPKELIALVSVRALAAVGDVQNGLKLLPGHVLEAWHYLEESVEPDLLRIAAKVAQQILSTDAEPSTQERERVRSEVRAQVCPPLSTDGSRAAAATVNEPSPISRTASSQSQQQQPQLQVLDDRCKSCHRQVLSRTLLPCAHLALCQQCSEINQSCPVCGSAILATIVTYIC